MEIWPKNYDAPRVLILDDDVSTEKTVRLSIEDEDDNVSETVLLDRDEAIQIIDHLKQVFSMT